MTSNVSKCINEHFAKAKEEGIEKGIQEGIEKGIESRDIEIVLNMLGEGLDEATISKFTKIEIDKVAQIIKNNHN